MGTSVAHLMRKGHRAATRTDFEAACEAFEQAASVAPRDIRPQIQLARVHALSGEYDAARATSEAVVEQFPDDALVGLLAGRCLLECGEARKAMPLLEQAVAKLPDNPVARQYLALCALMNDDSAAAILQFEKAGLPGGVDFLALLSHEVERRILPAGLVEDREAPPPSAVVREYVERLEARMAGKSESTFRGRRARNHAVGSLARQGVKAYAAKRYADAAALFEAALRIQPEDREALVGAGASLTWLGGPNRAVEYLEKALGLQPDDVVTQSMYGGALAWAGRFEEALAMFSRIEPVGPDDFNAHYGRGACLAALGRKRESLEQFRIAFARYRLEAFEDNLTESWREYRKRAQGEKTWPAVTVEEAQAGERQ